MVRLVAVLVVCVLAGCDVAPSSPPNGGGKADNLSDLEHCGYQAPMRTGVADFDAVVEISGLAASRRFGEIDAPILWAHNDGDEPVLFAVDRTGALVREFVLDGAPAHDWEDMSMGPGPDPSQDYLYIADTGDNNLERKRIQLLRLPEPDPQDPDLSLGPVEVFELDYGDGDPHDAEAMFVDPIDGRVYIVTKRTDDDDRRSKLFASTEPLPEGGGDVELARVLTEKKAPHLDGVWVAADISAAGDEIVLVQRKGPNLVFSRETGQSIASALTGEPCKAPRSPGDQEAIAFSAVGGGYYMLPEGKAPPMTFAAEQTDCPKLDVSRSVELRSPLAVEVSGVVLSQREPGHLWVINDPGPQDRDVIVALGRDGTELGAVRLEVDNIDWEDLAVGPGPEANRSYLYVGDIGDNAQGRDEVLVHRVLEPSLSAISPGMPTRVPSERLRFFYDDGRSRDAESLTIDPTTGDLYVVSRRRDKDDPTTLFVAHAPFSAAAASPLVPLGTHDLGDVVTGADLSSDGNRLVLRLRGKGNIVATRHPEQSVGEMLASGCRGPGGSVDHDSVAIDGAGYLMVSERNPAEIQFVEPR